MADEPVGSGRIGNTHLFFLIKRRERERRERGEAGQGRGGVSSAVEREGPPSEEYKLYIRRKKTAHKNTYASSTSVTIRLSAVPSNMPAP